MNELSRIKVQPAIQSGKLLLLRGKLSNSGDILKLLIPNLEKIFRGGWTNYSCMVISQKMALLLYCLKCSNYRLYYQRAVEILSRIMDNRGSKSNKMLSLFVKAQRVDGSLFLSQSLQRFKNLRYTLRGFERISSSGIPSNKIINKRLYSTTNDPKNLKKELFKNEGSFNLNPWF